MNNKDQQKRIMSGLKSIEHGDETEDWICYIPIEINEIKKMQENLAS